MISVSLVTTSPTGGVVFPSPYQRGGVISNFNRLPARHIIGRFPSPYQRGGVISKLFPEGNSSLPEMKFPSPYQRGGVISDHRAEGPYDLGALFPSPYQRGGVISTHAYFNPEDFEV